jgi:hypothetical protein
MKTFLSFAEIDAYFFKLFSGDSSFFKELKYNDAPLCFALQHNLYDYYKNFVHKSTVRPSLSARVLFKLRILGIDHRLKLGASKMLVVKEKTDVQGKIIFFSDNYVPRILDDFQKVMSEIDQGSIAFCTTDYRAYKYMLKKKGDAGYNVILIRSSGHKRNSSARKKLFADFKTIIQPKLENEFGGLAKGIVRIIRFNLNVLAAHYDLFEEWLTNNKPQKIVFGSDGFSIARVLCFAAKKKSMDTFVLQHGLIDSFNGYLPLVADKIFLWSSYEKKLFEANGVSSDRLLITSSPRFDQIRPINSNVDLSSPNQVLFVTSPASLQDAYGQVDTIAHIRKNLNKEYLIVIRPHPYYKEIIKTYCRKVFAGDKNVSFDEKPFLQSIKESGLVVFASISTGIFEALSLGRRFCILFSKEQDEYDLYRFPKIPADELINTLNNGSTGFEDFSELSISEETSSIIQNTSAASIKKYLLCS